MRAELTLFSADRRRRDRAASRRGCARWRPSWRTRSCRRRPHLGSTPDLRFPVADQPADSSGNGAVLQHPQKGWLAALFRYPESPIIMYAACYMMVSLIFFLGFLLEDRVACRASNPAQYKASTVTQGSQNKAGIMLSMILYFFHYGWQRWWVILTITWFLAAVPKWGSEAIEKKALLFPAEAWGNPGTLTVILSAMNKMEGDRISGMCFVGLYDVAALSSTGSEDSPENNPSNSTSRQDSLQKSQKKKGIKSSICRWFNRKEKGQPEHPSKEALAPGLGRKRA
ncbi:hypothetical protein MJT46_017471 [Ovis ammon polii x Ovis aries]|nr:hypothetical protein MJT46_017471 [Ovis ammon polii x Ovis aries]